MGLCSVRDFTHRIHRGSKIYHLLVLPLYRATQLFEGLLDVTVSIVQLLHCKHYESHRGRIEAIISVLRSFSE
jgi:hypothetical protein